VRATKSRDIRAPRVTELFTQGTTNGFNITNNGVTASIPAATVGNPALDPEVADTFTGGFVLAPKSGFASGFRLSIDYFRINVKGVIGSVAPPDIIDRYYKRGFTEYAKFIKFDNSQIGFSRIDGQFLNLNALETDGVDLEASYRVPLDAFHLPGRLDVNALVTWMNRYATIDQLGNTTIVTNRVGVTQGQTGPLPRWRGNVTVNYALGRFSSTLQARAFSGFLVNPALIGPDNPLYNPALSTSVNDNKSPGLAYWSFSARYDIVQKGGRFLQVYGVVDNLFDKDPPITGLPMSSIGGIPYDFIGRSFKVGVRMTL
jgi:hypothetical protein